MANEKNIPKSPGGKIRPPQQPGINEKGSKDVPPAQYHPPSRPPAQPKRK